MEKTSNYKFGIQLVKNASEPSLIHTIKVTKKSILGAHAVFLVYDITNQESFESITNFWLNEVESYADPGAVLVLIGTKYITKETSQI